MGKYSFGLPAGGIGSQYSIYEFIDGIPVLLSLFFQDALAVEVSENLFGVESRMKMVKEKARCDREIPMQDDVFNRHPFCFHDGTGIVPGGAVGSKGRSMIMTFRANKAGSGRVRTGKAVRTFLRTSADTPQTHAFAMSSASYR